MSKLKEILENSDKQKDQTLQKEALEKRLKEVTNSIESLSKEIENNPPPSLLDSALGFLGFDSDKEKTTREEKEKKHDALTKQLSEYKLELTEYNDSLSQQKEKALDYVERKKQFLEILDNVLKDPEGLNEILVPLADVQKEKTGITLGEYASAGLNAVGFLVKNKVVNLFEARSLVSLYQEEFSRLNKVLSGKETYTAENAPFFIKLLSDPEFNEALKTKAGPQLEAVINTIAPTIITVLLKELGKIDSINKDLTNKNTELLEAQEKSKKEDDPDDRKKSEEVISKLRDEIKDLEGKQKIATLITDLGNNGINAGYINSTLTPIITKATGSLVNDPTNLVLVANLAVSGLVTSTDPLVRQANLVGALTSGAEILKNEKVTEVLNKDLPKYLQDNKDILVNAIPNIIPLLPQTAKDAIGNRDLTKVAPLAIDLAANAVPTVVKVATAIATEPAKLVDAYNAFEQYGAAGKDKAKESAALTKMVTSGAEILKNEKVTEVLNKDLPKYLRDNKDILVNAIPNIIPLLPQTAKDAIGNRDLTKVAPLAIDLAANAVPTVVKVATAIATEPAKLVDAYNAFEQYGAAGKDKAKESAALTKMVTSGAEILKNEKVTEVLNKDLPKYLRDNKDILVNAIPNIIPLLPQTAKDAIGNRDLTKVAPLAIDLAANAVPTVVKVATAIATEPAKLVDAYNAFEQYGAAGKDKTKESAALTKMVTSGAEILKNEKVTEVLNKDLPKYLRDNKDILVNAIPNIIPLLPQTAKDAIGNRDLTKVAPLAIDLAANAVPTVVKVATAIATEPAKLVDAYNAFEQYGAAGKDKAKESAALTKMVTSGAEILKNEKVTEVLNKDLPKYLRDNKDILVNAIPNIIPLLPQTAKDAIGNRDLTKVAPLAIDLAANAVPTVVKVATAIATEPAKLVDAYNAFEQYGAAGKDKTKESAALTKMVTSGAEILKNEKVTEVLNKDLPEYIVSNKDALVEIVDKVIETNEPIKKLLEESGIDQTLVKEAAILGTKFVAQSLPVVNKLAIAASSDPNVVVKIVNEVQDVMNAPLADKETKILGLVASLIDVKNKNKAVGEVIDKDLPKLLMDNSKELGEVVDKFLNTTKVGKNLNNKGQKIIEVASKKLPQLTELSELYTKHKYGAMIPKVMSLLSDKEVRKLVISGITAVIKSKNQKDPVEKDENFVAAKISLSNNANKPIIRLGETPIKTKGLDKRNQPWGSNVLEKRKEQRPNIKGK